MSATAPHGSPYQLDAKRPVHTATRRPLSLRVAAFTTLLAAAWLVPEALRHLRADLTAGPARIHVNRGSAPTALNGDEEWQMAFAKLGSAVTIAGDDANAHGELGALYSAASQRSDLSESEQLVNAALAVTHLALATSLRPADPRGWADLARARLLSNDAGPAYLHAWEFAAELGPFEGAVRSQLFEMTLFTHPDPHTPAMAAWAQQIYTSAEPPSRKAMQRAAARFDVAISEEGVYSPALTPESKAPIHGK